jgi:hypothetical protein
MNADGLFEDLVSKDYIDIVYKKANHTFKCLLQSTCIGYQSGVSQNMYFVSRSLDITILVLKNL